MLKDIIKLKYFKNSIKVVCGIITKFHMSHLGTAELKVACKTIPVIKKVMQNGSFDLEDLATDFQPHTSHSTMEFEFHLAQLVNVGMLGIKALACLEAVEATAADVFIFWHAMIQAMKDILTNPKQEFPQEVQQQIFRILNSCHQQLFEDENLSNQVYLAETYLDSTYLKSDLFKSEAEDNDSYAGIHHVATFKNLAQFLMDLAEKEIKHGDKEAFTTWQNCAGAFKAQFLGEFKVYAHHQYPFNLPVDEKKGV
ncbi:hypothetical protein L208DRAFT_1380680 [Tricholoma matsutake]|nr:hypothetical protein L208DRAFT_1380680 [Tricholoma matsutake 945]